MNELADFVIFNECPLLCLQKLEKPSLESTQKKRTQGST